MIRIVEALHSFDRYIAVNLRKAQRRLPLVVGQRPPCPVFLTAVDRIIRLNALLRQSYVLSNCISKLHA